MPGAIIFATRRISPRFCRSARTARAMPGYWTLTATRRPSCSRARYTWPIEAAANASGLELGEHVLERLLRGRTRSPCASPRTTRAAPSRAAPRASPRAARATSGGSAPVSTNEATWPIFIAAPFICPSTSRMRSAVCSCRCWPRPGGLLRAGEVGGAARRRSAPPGRRPGRRAAPCGAAGRSGSSSFSRATCSPRYRPATVRITAAGV